MSTRIGVPVATVWTGPQAPRPVDATATADRPDVGAWTAVLDGTSRRGLHGRTLTQALLGEPVEVVEEIDGWARVRLPWQPHGPEGSGYPGWVRQTHLLDDASQPAGGEVRAVAVPTAVCTVEGGAPWSLSYGTVLPVVDADAASTVLALPDGRRARLSSADLRSPETAADVSEVLTSARQHVGLRYLWGGACGWGLDCSGFVHLVHRVHGVTVPRDASDQHEQARAWPRPEQAGPGSLFFFARPGERAFHVGFASDGARDDAGRAPMLHAPESGPGDGGLVEDAPMAADRVATLVGAGTFLDADVPDREGSRPGT